MKAKKQNFIIGLLMCSSLIGCGGDGGDGNIEAKDAIITPTVEMGEIFLTGREQHYDYSPAMMIEKTGENKYIYRLWWCGNWEDKGDHILYSESKDGLQYSSPVVAFYPDFNNNTAFDRDHVCDPSVIKMEDSYYLYYSGLNNNKIGKPIAKTEIGLAKGEAPTSFVRVGKIIDPTNHRVNAYGAGQPSVFYKDGYYYIGWHDDTGKGVTDPNYIEGLVGQKWYISKSSSPYFNMDVLNLVAGVWTPSETNRPQALDYYTGSRANASMSYIEDTNIFVIVQSQMQPDLRKVIAMLTFDSFYTEYNNIEMHNANWMEGVGISRNEKGAIVKNNLYTIYPVGNTSPFSWDLYINKVNLDVSAK